jgi:hypothetical protein
MLGSFIKRKLKQRCFNNFTELVLANQFESIQNHF